jgi:hypothetical protein
MKRLGHILTPSAWSRPTGWAAVLACLVVLTNNPALTRADQARAALTDNRPLPASPAEEEEESKEVALAGHRHKARQSHQKPARAVSPGLVPPAGRDRLPPADTLLRPADRPANYPLRC